MIQPPVVICMLLLPGRAGDVGNGPEGVIRVATSEVPQWAIMSVFERILKDIFNSLIYINLTNIVR
ncbi:hypothetical protein D4N07_05455 [Enterobacter hormaechei]|nr:hypothetical protein D4N07_05455 [Enterobacter hormaechei]